MMQPATNLFPAPSREALLAFVAALAKAAAREDDAREREVKQMKPNKALFESVGRS